jgi:hypothetical protein
VQPTTESCNGLDDDCDGAVDENLTRDTECGVGECASTGFETCTVGAWGDDTCNLHVTDDSVCDEGNACTQTDTCQGGSCVGANPVVCTAKDQCHVAGTCDQASGECSNPAKADYTACNDGNACTQADSCMSGSCIGSNPVTCTALDQCHDTGTCDTTTGECSNPNKANGAPCNDGNLCTQTDACQGGSCVGGNPVVCSASDQCHGAGACDTLSGACSYPPLPEGTLCNDNDACTTGDVCNGSGVCAGTPGGCNPLTVTPSTQQYSDLVTFTATLSPGSTGGVARATGVKFLVGTQEVGTATLTPSNGNLVGTLANVPLLEPTPFGTKPTGQMAPGTHTVTAKFIAPKGKPGIPDLTTTLTITPEDARTTYTGSLLVATASAKSGKAAVTLSTTVQDITALTGDPAYDAKAGDIRNAKVTFVDQDNGNKVLCTASVGLVSAADTKTGTATCTWNADIGSADSQTYTVGTVVNNDYIRDDPSEDAVITITRPGTNYVSGSGFLVMSNSGGLYPGKAGTRNTFGFYAKYPAKGKNPDGYVVITMQSGNRIYQIRSASLTSLTSPASGKAILTAKATIREVTSRRGGDVIDRDAALQLTMTDKGEPGTSDTLGITVWNTKGGLWFSSNWDGTKTVEQTLGKGNLVVR